MKQKLVLLFALGFLITAPALADAINPVRVADVSGFGTPSIANGLDLVNGPGYQLALGVEVFYDGGIYTYVYSLVHNADFLNSFQILNGLYDIAALNWGWVDSDAASSDPFSLPVSVVPFLTTFSFDNFANNQGAGPLLIYIQSTLPPTATATEYFFATGSGGGSTDAGQTLGPTDAGGGASFDVPEPSSLLLLTFGLVSGGVLRLSTRRTNR